MKTVKEEEDVCLVPVSGRTSVVSEDNVRLEMGWEDTHEHLFREWVKDCQERSAAHAKKAKNFKRLYQALGIPATLLPIILSGITDALKPHEYVLTAGLVVTGVITGVSTFLNPGQKAERHWAFEAKFAEIVNDIRVILSKPRQYRLAADVALERYLNAYNTVCGNAPPT